MHMQGITTLVVLLVIALSISVGYGELVTGTIEHRFHHPDLSDMSKSYREVRLHSDNGEYVLKGETPNAQNMINSLPWGSEVEFRLKPTVVDPLAPLADGPEPEDTGLIEGSVISFTSPKAKAKRLGTPWTQKPRWTALGDFNIYFLAVSFTDAPFDQNWSTMMDRVRRMSEMYKRSSYGMVNVMSRFENGSSPAVFYTTVPWTFASHDCSQSRKIENYVEALLPSSVKNGDAWKGMQTLLYFMPQRYFDKCGGSWANGGHPSTAMSKNEDGSLFHEIGHQLGMGHAGKDSQSYGDYSEIMGNLGNLEGITYGDKVAHMNAMHKSSLGWLRNAQGFREMRLTTETIPKTTMRLAPLGWQDPGNLRQVITMGMSNSYNDRFIGIGSCYIQYRVRDTRPEVSERIDDAWSGVQINTWFAPDSPVTKLIANLREPGDTWQISGWTDIKWMKVTLVSRDINGATIEFEYTGGPASVYPAPVPTMAPKVSGAGGTGSVGSGTASSAAATSGSDAATSGSGAAAAAATSGSGTKGAATVGSGAASSSGTATSGGGSSTGSGGSGTPPPPPGKAPLQFFALASIRLLDSRPAESPQALYHGGAFAAGEVRTYSVSKVGVPSNARALSATVQMVNAAVPGFLTIWPANVGKPTASSINSVPGVAIAASVYQMLDPTGSFSIFSFKANDVIFDISGYFAPASSGGMWFNPLAPVRMIETRGYPGAVYVKTKPVDGNGFTESFAVSGVPSNAGAVSVTAALVPRNAAGFISMWPGDTSWPGTSMGLFTPGTNIEAAAIVVTTGGRVSVRANVPVDTAIDVDGYFATDAPYGLVPLASPLRILDTRGDPNVVYAGSAFNAGEVRTYPVGGQSFGGVTIPADAAVVVATVTAVSKGAAGYLTIFPGGTVQPMVSQLNFAAAAGTASALGLNLKLSASGTLSVFAQQSVDIIIDIVAFYAPKTYVMRAEANEPSASQQQSSRSAAHPVPGYGVALIVILSVFVAAVLVALVVQLRKMREEQLRAEPSMAERQSPLLTAQQQA